MATGKAYINNKEVPMDEYMKFHNLSMKEKIEHYGVSSEDLISKTDTNNDITNLNPSKKKKIVTVPINTGGSNTVPVGNGSSSKEEEETIIVVDNTLTAVNQINTQFT